MKRFKRLGILLGALAMICGVTFGVSRYEQRKEEIKNSDEVILELAVDDVTALSWEYDGTSLAFHKDEGWRYDEDENFPVSEEKMDELLGMFESFGVSFIIENVEDYAQYGLGTDKLMFSGQSVDVAGEFKDVKVRSFLFSENYHIRNF